MTGLINIFLILIGAFITVPSFYLFKQIFIEQEFNFVFGALSSFYAAFFAFLFVRLADFFNNLYKRRSKSYNGLVYLDKFLNTCLNVVHDNITNIESFQRSIANKALFVGHFYKFPTDAQSLHDLINIKFINKIFSLTIDLKRANEDMQMIDDWYGGLRNALIEKHIPEEIFLKNVNNLSKQVDENLRTFFNKLKNDIFDLIAENRILMKKEKPITGHLIRQYRIKRLEEKKEKEKRAISQELKLRQELWEKEKEKYKSS